MGYSLWGLRELDLTERLSILKCHAAAKSLQSCPTLCDPMDCSPPGSSVQGILQAEYWSGLPSPPPAAAAKSPQSCPTLCDPMDCSMPGSSVHGDSLGKNTGQVAMPSSRGFSQPRD